MKAVKGHINRAWSREFTGLSSMIRPGRALLHRRGSPDKSLRAGRDKQHRRFTVHPKVLHSLPKFFAGKFQGAKVRREGVGRDHGLTRGKGYTLHHAT